MMGHTNLVEVMAGEAVASSMAIAEGIGKPHAGVIKLIRLHLSDLEYFGLVRFEIQPRRPGKHGGSDTEYALLNEQQATLLMTYMRNSQVVRQFKRRLVASFFQMRDAIHIPQDYSAALRLIADQHDRSIQLEQQNQVLVSQIAEQSAKVAFHDAVTGGDGLYSIRDAAALLGTGQNRLMKRLKGLHWVDRNNRPYQRKLEGRLMDCKLSRFNHPTRGTMDSVTPMITAKGLAKLQQLVNAEQTKHSSQENHS